MKPFAALSMSKVIVIMSLMVAAITSIVKAQTVFTVDPTGSGTYKTIQEALNQLNNSTLTNDVVIDIAKGVYNEELQLLSVKPGSGYSITLQSKTGKAADVVLVNTNVSLAFDYILNLQKVQNVTLKQLTFRGAADVSHSFITLGDSTANLHFENLLFNQANSISRDQYAIAELIDLVGFNVGGTCQSLDVTGCSFKKIAPFQTAIYNYKILELNFTQNAIDSTTVPSWLGEHLNLSQNIFTDANIGVIGANSFEIDQNKVYSSGADIILINRRGNKKGEGYITNNFFLQEGYNNAVNIFDNGNPIYIANNTISVDRGDACISFTGKIDSINIYNNVLYGLDNEAFGLYVFDALPKSFSCDYNDYYFPNSTGVWRQLNTRTAKVTDHVFADLPGTFSLEGNGLNVDPSFVSATDLHALNTVLKDAGKSLPYITHDIDNALRKGLPDIGADEIEGFVNLQAVKVSDVLGTLEPGKTIQVAYEVKNAGSLDIKSQWTDVLYLSRDGQVDASDLVLKTINIAQKLGVGDAYTRTESINVPLVPAGNYYVLLQANSEQDVLENNFNDNLAASDPLRFKRAQLSDLEVTAVVTPGSQYSGKSFELEWTVKNNGSVTTPGAWVDAIYMANSITALNNPRNLNNDSLLIVKRPSARSLTPGQSYTSKWTVDIPLRYSGKLYYRVQTNAGYAFFEEDTAYIKNGLNSSAVNVTQSALPDLVMIDLNTANTAFSNEKVAINWTVRNQGLQKTFRTRRQIFEEDWLDRSNYNYWTDVIYLSRKPYYDENEPSQRIVATFYRPDEELEIGGGYTVKDSFTIGRCDYGKYYLIGVANYDQYTYELTYSNNIGPLDSIEVKIDPVPDLRPTQLKVTNTPESGKELKLDYTLLNDGFSDKPATGMFEYFCISKLDTFNADECLFLGRFDHTTLLAMGQSETKSLVFDVPFDVFGDYYIYAISDYTNRICEAQFEGNNRIRSAGKVRIEIADQPDLVPSFVSVADTLEAGGSYTLIARVENQGQADAVQGAWQDQVNLGGKQLFQLRRTPPLEMGKAFTDTFSITVPLDVEEGDHLLAFVADERLDLVEYGFENNNTVTKKVFVERDLTKVPDLAISNLAWVNTGTITAGDDVTLQYDLQNTSAATKTNGWKDKVVIKNEDDQVVWSKELTHVGGLTEGESKTFQQSFQLPFTLEGLYSIEYRVNAKPSFVEYNLTNNEAKLQQSIAAYVAPDLEVTQITFADCCQKYALQDDAYLLSITNNGPGDLKETFVTIRAFIALDRLGNTTSSTASQRVKLTLDAGASTVVSLPVKWDYNADGDYYPIAIVDVQNEVYEDAGEHNNRFAAKYTINLDNDPVELAPSSLTVLSNTAPFNDLLKVGYTVQKGTNKALKRNIDDRLVLSSDRILDENDLQFGAAAPKLRDLARNASSYSDELLASLPKGLLPGYYFIGVNVDGLNNVLEQDESDNILFSQDSFYIDFSVPLTLDQIKQGKFYEGTTNGREYFRVQRPKDAGMLVSLDFSNDAVSSELYHREQDIPTDAVYDHKYNNPFLADQQILVPVTDSATTDYLFLKANKVPWVNSNPADFSCFLSISSRNSSGVIRGGICNYPDTVPYTLLAERKTYSIHQVSPDSGSYYGISSVGIYGFDFEKSMTFFMVKGTDTIHAQGAYYVSSTEYAAHFDLRGKAAGQYTMHAKKKTGEPTELKQAFTVFDGAPAEPFTSIQISSDLNLVNQSTVANIDFGNVGYANGYDYWLLVSFAPESFNTESLSTTYVGSSDEDYYDQLPEHPNLPSDSGFVDIDGVRFYAYWIPHLSSRQLSTFTYQFHSSVDEHILVQAHLYAQPLSRYSFTGDPDDLHTTATVHKLVEVAVESVEEALRGKKGGYDCNNLTVKNVEKDILKQTWEMGQRVHGGVKVTAGSASLKEASVKVFNNYKKDVKGAFDIKGNLKAGAKDKGNLKKLLTEHEKPAHERMIDYAKDVFNAANPFENLKTATKPKDPPFADLINNVFGCIDNDDLKSKIDKCTYTRRMRDLNTGEYFEVSELKQSCRKDFGQKPLKKTESNALTNFVKSIDPNEIKGPEGETEARFIKKDETLQYTIFFENLPTASAPARFVAIDNELPQGLRPQSFRLTSYGFGDTVIHVSATNALRQTVQLGKAYNRQKLDVVAGYDVIAGSAFWRFTTVDAQTGNMVTSPLEGFLPPNDSTGIGQGFVTYEIKLEPNAASGLKIANQADIIFDQNEVIATNVWENTVVNSEAESEVLPLPAISPKAFTVSWEGNSGTNGAGIKEIEVFVSKNGGPYNLWLSSPQSSSATFIGEHGATYDFYSILTTLDNTVEYAPVTADASTTVKDSTSSVPEGVLGAASQVRLYPNPNRGDVLYIETGNASGFAYQVVNLEGKTVLQGNFAQTRVASLAVGDLSEGMYLLKVQTEGAVQTLRFVLNRE